MNRTTAQGSHTLPDMRDDLPGPAGSAPASMLLVRIRDVRHVTLPNVLRTPPSCPSAVEEEVEEVGRNFIVRERCEPVRLLPLSHGTPSRSWRLLSWVSANHAGLRGSNEQVLAKIAGSSSSSSSGNDTLLVARVLRLLCSLDDGERGAPSIELPSSEPRAPPPCTSPRRMPSAPPSLRSLERSTTRAAASSVANSTTANGLLKV
mmetsp:Transcript_32226/g.84504  ORF Transcript_32226/g.84504 Transcript_32226/m.84504 type:complete len:205 (+) Transcript_32226:195-809(+)